MPAGILKKKDEKIKKKKIVKAISKKYKVEANI